MGGTRRSIALLTALGLLAVVPVTAQAQTDLKLVVAPFSPTAGAGVMVSLDGCKTPTVATSPGFQAPAKLERRGENAMNGFTNVVEKAGDYVATAECDGKSYTAQFSVVNRPQPSWGFGPLEVEPGGTVTASTNKMTCLPEPVTSPGFTKPIYLSIVPPSTFQGSTTVITTPGTYTATFRCSNGAAPTTQQFTIKAPSTTTPPPGKPKPPIVKPKGAANTGGGGTA
ncbi:hypothetical protein FXN61_03730 [Lentzea sp. PSKA42]|uniref:Ig-like domain-containing protein n=1 Tax=Lentzea indica TaxID=2604800 RepID=A0ABX1FAM4_9PSEU|nr:hypothetical protein [Lentzea indica]NKE55983.1 hypothetical protein [Lentzea indica]